MWQPTIQQFKELFSNDHILTAMVLMNKKSTKNVTPSELSDLLKIHITTAKKYLELLTKYGFTTKNVLSDKQGRPSVYTLTTTTLTIALSLDKESEFQKIEMDFWNPLIREPIDIDKIATYDHHSEGLIQSFKTKIKTKAKRLVTFTIELDNKETYFMKYLPFPTDDPKPLIKICTDANITSPIEIKSIENFVRKLTKYNLIEIVQDE